VNVAIRRLTDGPGDCLVARGFHNLRAEMGEMTGLRAAAPARLVTRGSGMVFNRTWLWSKFVTCTCACELLTAGAASTRPGLSWQAGGRDNPGCIHMCPE
jgi:hypothetical protein